VFILNVPWSLFCNFLFVERRALKNCMFILEVQWSLFCNVFCRGRDSEKLNVYYRS
jgi:hypothetical protein